MRWRRAAPAGSFRSQRREPRSAARRTCSFNVEFELTPAGIPGTSRRRGATACRRTGSCPPPRRHAAAAAARSAPVPTTERTRPPFVTSRPSRSPVPAWKTSAPVWSASSMPWIGSPARGRSGYPSAARTTQTAAPGCVATLSVASRPSAQANSSSARSRSSSGKMTWVSGSPKRQLNSSAIGPSEVSISPA